MDSLAFSAAIRMAPKPVPFSAVASHCFSSPSRSTARSFSDHAVPLQQGTAAADGDSHAISPERAAVLQRLSVLEAVSTVDLSKLADNPALDDAIQGLRVALEKEGVIIGDDGRPETITNTNLVLWALLHGTPFVAFGFMDNA